MGNPNRDSRGGQPAPRPTADWRAKALELSGVEMAFVYPGLAPPEPASLEPNPTPAEPIRVEGTAPDASALVSEIAALRTRAEEAEAELDRARATIALRDLALGELRAEGAEALAAQARRFDEAWAKRELSLAAPPPGPVKGHRAVGKHVLVIGGARVRVEHGQSFPEGYDVSTLPAGTFEEIR